MPGFKINGRAGKNPKTELPEIRRVAADTTEWRFMILVLEGARCHWIVLNTNAFSPSDILRSDHFFLSLAAMSA